MGSSSTGDICFTLSTLYTCNASGRLLTLHGGARTASWCCLWLFVYLFVTQAFERKETELSQWCSSLTDCSHFWNYHCWLWGKRRDKADCTSRCELNDQRTETDEPGSFDAWHKGFPVVASFSMLVIPSNQCFSSVGTIAEHSFAWCNVITKQKPHSIAMKTINGEWITEHLVSRNSYQWINELVS